MFNLTQAEKLLENFKRINSALPVKDEETTDDSQESLEEITLDLEKAKQLIQDFKKLEKPPERKKAFLEIIGLSHLEAVSSKALAFFFDTDEVHQLKDLCVQALFDCILDRVKSKSEPAISTQSVEREVITEEGSRIDIIINTYDDLIIIENKLFHTVNNPFESYVNYGKLRRGERNGHYIILGIHKPETLPEHFKFISHFDLADAIRNRLGDYLMDADQHYVTLLVDYLHALDDFNPNSRIGKMEQAIVNFFGNNHDQLAEIYEARQHFIDYAKQKIENCNILFKEQNISIFDGNTENDSFPPDWLGFTIWSKSFTENEFSQNHGIAFYIAVGCYTKGCTLSLEYSKNLEGRGVPKDCLIKLKSILDEMNIEHDEMEEYADDAQFVIIRQASWDETPEKIVSEYLPIIKKIESALNLDKEA